MKESALKKLFIPIVVLHAGLSTFAAQAQTISYWDGGPTGTSRFWTTAENWEGDVLPPSAADSNLVFYDRPGIGELGTMTISASRIAGLITFDNINFRFPPLLEIHTNSAGSTARSLTLHTGITLQNMATTVHFTGLNGALSMILGADNTFTTSAGATLQISAVISGAFRLTKAGEGTVYLEEANTFTGGLTINEGTLRILAGAGVGGLPSSVVADQVIINGGTLEYAGAGVTSGSNRGFALGSRGGTISVTGIGTYQIAGLLSNVAGQSGALRKTGPGTLYLNHSSAASSYSGGTTVVSGTLQYGRAGSLGTGPVTLGEAGGGSATLENTLAGWLTANDIIVAAGSGGTLTLAYTSSATGSGNSLFSGAFTLNDNLTIRSESGVGVAMRISGAISGTGHITKTGAGTVRIENENDWSGGITVASGTLEYGRKGSLGTGGITLGTPGGGNATLDNYLGGWSMANDLTVASGSGGTLTLAYTSSASFNSHFAGSVTLNDHLVIRSEAVEGQVLRMSGAISGAGNITKTGAGVLRFENENTGYSGTTTISSGTLQLSSNITLGTHGGLGSGDVVNNAVLLISRSNNHALTNQISGTGSVTHAGSGTTILSNANTYSGGTTVSAGTLLAANLKGSATGSGGLTTAQATTLGGTGTLAPTGKNEITLGGAVRPGITGVDNGIGTLTFTPVDGNVTFQGSSSIVFEIGSNGVNDRIVFNASGSASMDFSAMAEGSLGVTFAAGYTPALNDSFDLLDWAAVSGAGIAGLRTSLLSLSTTGFDATWFWDLSEFTTNGVVTIAAVPEASRAVLAGMGVALLLLRRHRRK